MLLPTGITATQNLPAIEVDNDKINTSTLPHEDEIIDCISNSNASGNPYMILTYRSIYVYDFRHNCCLNMHIRSEECLEKYGSNTKIKLSPNGQLIAVKTDKNLILLYSIKIKGSDYELLSVYSKTGGEILQNGYPLTKYTEDSLVYGGIDSRFETNSGKTGMVNNFLNSFLSLSNNEKPLFDLGLRLKLILNVASPIVEYCFINNYELMLINTNPHAFQVIRINSSLSDNEINVVLADELDWYNDPKINNAQEIKGMKYNYDLDCFLWFNKVNDILLVKRTENKSSKSLQLSANLIYSSSQHAVVKGLINHFKNLCYILLDNGDLLIFKIFENFTCKLIKTLKKSIQWGTPVDLVLSPNGDSFIVVFSSGWNVHSLLGNLNFSTFDYDHFKLSNNVKKIQFLNEFKLLVVDNNNKLCYLNLTNFNFNAGFNALTFKRPLLVDQDKIFIFKAFEKKLYDHHHYNFNIHDVTNKETDIWLCEMLPPSFRIQNDVIRSCSVSDDGNNVCVVGNYDVIVFNNYTKKWKFLENLQDSKSFEKLEIPIRKCIWWKNHLILGSYSNLNSQDKKSEVVIFNEKISSSNESFSYDSIVWGFNFTDTPFDEVFHNFNIDLFNDTLLVMTDKLNCYSWKMDMKTKVLDKIEGDQAVSKGKLYIDKTLATTKQELTLTKSTVWQLQSCFKETDDSIILNYGAISRVGEFDLLFLTNTDLYYIKREKIGPSFKYMIHLLTNHCEYFNKLNNSLIAIFDGSQLIHYNLSDNMDLLKLNPIKISIGNEILNDTNTNNKDTYIVKTSNSCPYPITTIANQNLLFRLEIESLNNFRLKLITNRRNYLSDLVNHYIICNMNIGKLKDESNAISINSVYYKFSKFSNFRFVLEKLMVDYLQQCYDNKENDSDKEYFSRLISLFELTDSFYEILINVLKKTENHFWKIFFLKFSKSPREIVDFAFNVLNNYRLSAHFFIVMLNYESTGAGRREEEKGEEEEREQEQEGQKQDESTSVSNKDKKSPINGLGNSKPKKKTGKAKKGKKSQVKSQVKSKPRSSTPEHSSSHTPDEKAASAISESDQELIFNILKKLILCKDFETSFELFRFLKIVDDQMTHKCLEKMKMYLKVDGE